MDLTDIAMIVSILNGCAALLVALNKLLRERRPADRLRPKSRRAH